MLPILVLALAQAGVAAGDLAAVAVTNRPGMVGCLLVGIAAAKAVAMLRGIPLVGVDHIQAHVHAALLAEPDMPLPALCLVASGGHTSLWLLHAPGVTERLGTTRDDAAGEALDKAAALLGLPYPGGPSIQRAAERGDPRHLDLPRPLLGPDSLDFSFSGLKTAVRIRATADGLAHGEGGDPESSSAVRDLVASFQRTVVGTLIDTTVKACRREGVATVLVAGGVACNRRLRRGFNEAASTEGLKVFMPSPRYTTDNAAMIGAAAFLQFERGAFAPLDLNADPNWKLGG
jgi:N6-L-threonylcarbamoyladenine synthase